MKWGSALWKPPLLTSRRCAAGCPRIPKPPNQLAGQTSLGRKSAGSDGPVGERGRWGRPIFTHKMVGHTRLSLVAAKSLNFIVNCIETRLIWAGAADEN